MAIKSENYFWSGILVTVIGGILLAAVLKFWESMRPYLQWIWEWLLYIFDFLAKGSALVPNWLLGALIVLSLYTIIIFFLRLRQEGSSLDDYRKDSFYGVSWEWTKVGWNIFNLTSFCPQCGLQIYPQQQTGIYHFPYIVFNCEHCGFKAQVEDMSNDKLENLLERQIHRKMRTGEWEQAVEESKKRPPKATTDG